jgi:hypothetical protein
MGLRSNSSSAYSHESSPQIFDETNIDQLKWPESELGRYAQKFLEPFIKQGVKHYIDNINTKLMALKIDDLVLPVTINDAEYENCYVCSPYGQYIVYGYEAVSSLKNPFIKKPLQVLIKGMGKIFQYGSINKVVIVNNWLFSTNLYPNISQGQISAIKSYLQQLYPEYAIIFRSIHTFIDSNLSEALKKEGFSLIPSRQIFFLNINNTDLFESRIFKSDLKLLKESAYEIASIENATPETVETITSLYRTVYLDRHSKQNPQLNKNFVKLACENQILNLKVLHKAGQIDAVVGYFQRNGVMTAPFLGYDVSLPQNTGLYRLCCTVLTLEAKEKQHLFHLSSGASFFKKIRRGIGHIEYTAVFWKHLPLKRRFPWNFLSGIANTIGIPVMKYYDK